MYRTSVRINSQSELTWVSMHSSSYAQLMEHRIERINIFQFLYGKLRGEHVVSIRTESKSATFNFYWIRTIAIIIMGMFSVMSASAENKVTREDNVFIVENTKAEKKASTPEATIYKVEIKGQKYTIYKGPKGGYFFYRTSKEGKQRREYINRNNYPEIYEQLKQLDNEKD